MIAEKRLAKGKARLASAFLLALLAGIFAAQPQAMAIHWWYTIPKYNEKDTRQYISLNTVSLYIPILRVTITIPAPSPEITQYEFESEVKLPDAAISSRASEIFYDVNGNQLASKHTVYLANGGGIITSHMYLEYGVWQNHTYTSKANALKVKDHLRVGEVTTNSPSHFVRRSGKNVGYINLKNSQKWENQLYLPMGGHPQNLNAGIPRRYCIGYTVYGENFPDDPTAMGFCKHPYWGDMYGPIVNLLHDFCVPSNMNMSSNGYLEYTGFWIDLVRSSDDDDE